MCNFYPCIRLCKPYNHTDIHMTYCACRASAAAALKAKEQSDAAGVKARTELGQARARVGALEKQAESLQGQLAEATASARKVSILLFNPSMDCAGWYYAEILIGEAC